MTEEAFQYRRLVVAEEVDRLDRFLADRTGMSRSRIVGLIREGRVLVDARLGKKSEGLSPGQVVEVEVPPPEPLEARPQDIPLDVVYEDDALLVVNKAAGLVVHPAPGHPDGTLVTALLFRVKDLSGIGGKLRPGIVHRLDRDTSGLMVVAKGDDAHVALSNAIRRREVRRVYRAVAWGHLAESPVTLDAPIDRDPGNRKRMAVVEGGRRAVTRLRVRERWRMAELLDVSLKTGRTHQIRVHLAHIGHPVVGDEVYGGGWARGMSGPARGWARELDRRARRQLLHASDLAFRHPLTGEEMLFRVPVPGDFEAVLEWARGGQASGTARDGEEPRGGAFRERGQSTDSVNG
ncbi:MAG: RluA family pseudouridine synthase [Longimicrobiales bacterium]